MSSAVSPGPFTVHRPGGQRVAVLQSCPPPLPLCVVGENECATLPAAGPFPAPPARGGRLAGWPQGLRPHSGILPKVTVIRIQAELCPKSSLVSQLQMWQDSQGWGLRRSTEGVTFRLPCPHLFHCSGCPPAGQPPAGRGRVAPGPRTTPEAGMAPDPQVPIKSVESQERGCTGPREAFGNPEQVNRGRRAGGNEMKQAGRRGGECGCGPTSEKT